MYIHRILCSDRLSTVDDSVLHQLAGLSFPRLRFCLQYVYLALVIPAAYHSVKVGDDAEKHSLTGSPDLDPIFQKGLLQISRGTAVLLLAVYVAYLWFQVRG